MGRKAIHRHAHCARRVVAADGKTPVTDRTYVFFAFLAAVLIMAALVILKGCGAGDGIVLALGSIATTLAGALAGISHSSGQPVSTTTTTDTAEPQKTVTKTEPV